MASEVTFDLAALVNGLLNSATTIVGMLLVGAKAYYGIRSEVRSMKEELQSSIASNNEDHSRLEEGHKDHEVRIRVLEKIN